MATLEMVPLRSAMPTGLLTVRRQVLQVHTTRTAQPKTTTTPQVLTLDEGSEETAVRKGGEAR